jgi:sugar O-acyltransferase (sialic acid O-acetyltransferase NeuD family)
MKKVVIIGARADGHAKVVLEILQARSEFQVVGFVDDNLFGSGITIRDIPVVGTVKDLPSLRDQYQLFGAIAAIGDNMVRRRLGISIKDSGLALINAVHPTVHFDSDVVFGEGNCFCQGVIVVTGTRIGNSVNIHTGATVDHDNIIGDGANLGPGVHTAGRVRIGMDAFLGTGTMVIPDCSVGEGAVTGAGTVVIVAVEPYCKVVGNPARLIKRINKPE